MVGGILIPNAQAHASSLGGDALGSQTSTAANTTSNYTLIDDPGLNNQPNAILFVTHVYVSPGNNKNAVYDPHPIGVFYNGYSWGIFNEDKAPMPIGAVFTVFETFGMNRTYDYTTIQKATVDNSDKQVTYIDNPVSNNNPNASLIVTPLYDPAGSCGCVYNPHPIGVYYNPVKGLWGIFNEDFAPMLPNTDFNVQAINASYIRQQATSANSTADFTIIDDPSTNGNPNLSIGVTQTFGNQVFNNHNIGVFYNAYFAKWAIFNEDFSPIPLNATFVVFADL